MLKMLVRIKMMRMIRSTMPMVSLGVAVFLFASASLCAARPISLEGSWRFEMDPTDAGERQLWFNRNLGTSLIRLPGILQSQNYGDEISTKTPWVLSLYDRFWFLRENYKSY